MTCANTGIIFKIDKSLTAESWRQAFYARKLDCCDEGWGGLEGGDAVF